MPGWNIGDMLDRLGAVLGEDAPALVHGTVAVSWPEFDRRTNSLARALASGDRRPGDRVGLMMRNRPEHLEAFAACLKARLVPFNVNYRYGPAEVAALVADARASLVFADEDLASLARSAGATVVVVDGGGLDSFAGDAARGPLTGARSADDMLFLYTGGTTGRPKAVMWAAGDLVDALFAARRTLEAPPADLDEIAGRALAGPRPVTVVASPLMHATGLIFALGDLLRGGTVVTVPGERFDPAAVWRAAADARADGLVIVGDAFAAPLLDALDVVDPAQLAALRTISSSGVAWSDDVKARLLRRLPALTLVDGLSSSEGLGYGVSITTAGEEGAPSGAFAADDRLVLLDAHGRPLPHGSRTPGRLALRGPAPRGYLNDPVRSAETFSVIDGVTHIVAGDWGGLRRGRAAPLPRARVRRDQHGRREGVRREG